MIRLQFIGLAKELANGDYATLTYQRFVKTTPKPSATKKSKGELVGPLLSSSDSSTVAVGRLVAIVVVMMIDMNESSTRLASRYEQESSRKTV